MSRPTSLLTSLNDFQESLVTAVHCWITQVRNQVWKEMSPKSAFRSPVINIAPDELVVLDLKSLLAAIPLCQVAIDDEAVQSRVQQLIASVVIETAVTSGSSWEALSELSWETARAAILIPADDSFAVSARAALGAIALTNFLWLFHHLRSDDRSSLNSSTLRMVTQPLAEAQRISQPWQPGDLWVWLIIARTVIFHYRAASKAHADKASKTHASKKSHESKGSLTLEVLCRTTAPIFLQESTLSKLIDAPRIPSILAQHAAYRQLPGLEILTSDSQATAARRLLIGELAFNLGEKPDGPGRGAFLRWMEGLLKLAEPQQPAAALSVAHLFWELLELGENAEAIDSRSTPNPRLATRLWNDPVVGEVLRRSVTDFEKRTVTTSTAHPLHSRLQEVADCLRCYDEYRALRKGFIHPPDAVEDIIFTTIESEPLARPDTPSSSC